jgi:uncharacterized protein
MFDRAVVDSETFAREAGELRGTIPLGSLPRLQDALFDQVGEVSYVLTGLLGKDGKPTLRIGINGKLTLVCQRCLGPMDMHLDSGRSFQLVPKGQPLVDPAKEEEYLEQIHADPALDVVELVEDEVLLALPMAPCHEEGSCDPPLKNENSDKQESPFSVLAALKRR